MGLQRLSSYSLDRRTLYVCVLCVLGTVLPVSSIYLPGTDRSYARFPKWNACTNASMSFEFKTTQRDNPLLMYVDDGGTYDFVEVTVLNGKVKLVLNIVDGRDGNVSIEIGNNMNDGRWHRVYILRNRMETTLMVDGQTDSRFAFGSDYIFGNSGNNSHVYFGGLPAHYHQIPYIHQLALPSVNLKHHLRGSIRNVLYGNCTCQTQRAVMLDGVGVINNPPEVCEVRNPCREGCLCISNDTAPACDCSELQCVTGIVAHYMLPMDHVSLNTIINPSGLDAKVLGTTIKVPGINNEAIRVDGKNSYIQVSGPSHRYECFGDLDKCELGYTLSFWVNFEQPCDGETVYLSNGGHDPNSHGVAMLYDRGNLQFRFRTTNGQEWRTKSDNVLPKRWYHVTASWSLEDGLALYIDGDLVETDMSPIMRSLGSRNRDIPAGQYAQSFIIGRANEAGPVRESCQISIDEFNFWSMLKSPNEVRELGPFYCYDIGMDTIRGNRVMNTNINAVVNGNPGQEPGKVGNALVFDGRGDYIDAGEQSDTCLGDTQMCLYGITVSMWIKFNQLRENMYFLSSGNKGMKLYYKLRKLVGELQKGSDMWKVEWAGAETGRWYFIELTWKPDTGLKMLVDLEEVAVSNTKLAREVEESNSQLYLGRANTNMRAEKYANAVYDEVQLCYGDRERLQQFGFIIRGRPTSQFFNMDSMSGGVLTHPNIDISLYGDPTLVAGIVRGGIKFDGNSQFAAFKDQGRVCMGNIDLCHHGLLLASWIKPGKLTENMEFFSTGANGIRAWYEGGSLKVAARTSTREWYVETSQLDPNNWQFLEISWDPRRGIGIYLNNRLVAFSSSQNVRQRDPEDGYWSELEIDKIGFYLGRGEGLDHNAKYANITFDEMEFWYGNRDYLIAFDYLLRGRPTRYFFTMDGIQNGKLIHPTMDIPVHGNPKVVPGKIYNALKFDGANQYIDLGQHTANCFGDISLCSHGFTGSMWANFQRFRNNMYYYSTGNGAKIYYKNGKLTFEVETPGKVWSVAVPDMETDTWYFLEYSWHPQKGLQVYVDNNLVGQVLEPRTVSVTGASADSHVYVGRANDNDGRFQYASAIIDEVEAWFGDRDYLTAFGHIQRDGVTHYSIAMENQRGNTLVHPDFDINLFGGASVVPGKIGNAVRFHGNGEYLSLGDQRDTCLGNLDNCDHGLTVSFLMNPQRFIENGYFLSSGPYSVYYKDGKLHAKFSTSTKTWEVATSDVELNRWQQIDLSWDNERGLQMFLDKTRVAENSRSVPNTGNVVTDYNIYMGRPNTNTQGYFSDVMMDELDYWYSNRDYLAAFGLLDSDVKRVDFTMDSISNGVLDHPVHKIYVYGGARTTSAVKGNGVLLNGANQYLDIGQGVICEGDLDQCPKGLTLRFKILPNTLQDNTYFLSSAPLNIYYRNGELVSEVRTPDKYWRASAPGLSPSDWHQIDVSWDPVDGLDMYIDSRKVASQPRPQTNRQDYNPNQRFFIGRADTNMLQERYPNAVIDDLQVWQARREFLIGQGLIGSEFIPGTNPTVGGGPIVEATTRPVDPFPGGPSIAKQDIIFNGNKWIAYDTRQLPDDYFSPSNFEEFHLKFKTEQPTGMLWWSGDAKKHMHISLKNGTHLIFFVDYGTGQTDRITVQASAFGNLADGEWHDVWIRRNGAQTVVQVDSLELPPLTMKAIASLFSKGAIYLAGGPDPGGMTGSIVNQNIYGTIKDATISGNNLPHDIDLVDLYWRDPRPGYVIENGDIDLSVSGPTTPGGGLQPGVGDGSGISFTQPGAYVILPKLQFKDRGLIEFKFLTKQPHGLMMYSGGRPGTRDFVALEMYDGNLYFVVDFGEGVHRYKFGGAGSSDLNDYQPHHVKVERDGRNLKLTLDGVSVNHVIYPGSTTLDLGTYNYFGGVDIPERLPWYLWTFGYKDYLGCIWAVKFNNQDYNLQTYAESQAKAGLEDGCPEMTLDCRDRPCEAGVCKEFWNGYACDCSETPKTGARCERPAPTLNFDGSDFVRINFHPMIREHTNDISLRFKTHKSSAVLFSTSNQETNEYLRVSLDNGRGKMETNLGGLDHITFLCDHLNDNEWHTLHIERRAGNLKYWVDDCQPVTTNLTGEGFTLDVDQILVASLGRNADPDFDFVGHMQNFIFNDKRFFDMLDQSNFPDGVDMDVNGVEIGAEKEIAFHPVTFRSGTNSYVYVPSLRPDGNMHLKFMFRTSDENGLLFYNGGEGQDFIMSELIKGHLYFGMNDGSDARTYKISDRILNDNEWHVVDVRQNGDQIFRVQVDDGAAVSVNRPISSHTFDLTDHLYVGSVEDRMYSSLHDLIKSRNGFSGCLATLKVDGKLYDLPNEAVSSSQLVLPGCTDAAGFCSLDTCLHYGVCQEALNTYICDCNMTAHVGPVCSLEPEGYRIGENKREGIAEFTFTHPDDSEIDRLAFGFMTWHPNGTMIQANSGFSSDNIHAKLENGHVVVVYDIGNGPQRIVEDRRRFNDGKYHYVTFVRRRGDATLRVDDFPENHISPGGRSTLFNHMKQVLVGGEKDYEGQIQNYFDGILAGVYINGYRVIDLGQAGDRQMVVRGDVKQAEHQFFLPRPSIVTPAPTPLPGGPSVLPGGEPSVVPGGTPVPPVIPPKENGGGVVWEEVGDGDGVAVVVEPGGGGVGVEGGANLPPPPGEGGVAAAAIGPGGVGGAGGEGARAGAVAGAMLGILMLASGMGWALYKFKPGLIGGGGGAAAVSNPMNISAPRATTNYQLVAQSSSAGLGSGYRAGGAAANGVAATGVGITAGNASTQTPAGMGPAGPQSANFQMLQGSAAAGSGIAGVSAGRGTVTRPTQTDLFFLAGPAPVMVANGGAAGAAYGAGGGAGFGSSSYSSSQVTTTNVRTGLEEFDMLDNSMASANSAAGGGGYGQGYGSGYATATSVRTLASAETQTPDVSPVPAPSPQQMAMYGGQNQSQAMSSSYLQGQSMQGGGYQQNQGQAVGGGGYQGASYVGDASSSSMFSSSYKESSSHSESMANAQGQSGRTLSPPPDATLNSSYQMRNMALMNSAGIRTSQNPNIFLAAEEIRVDCLQLTDDGRYVVTGSIFGPPQIWDMRTGELVRVMAGEDLSSTDLHLAAGDSLLVGQVAEMTQVDPSDTLASSRIHNRKLQLWDFATGRPLEMGHNELCTASVMMKDGEKVVLGRTDKFGGGTTIVIWDLLGNEPVRKLKLDASIGFADHISYLNLSKDNRYVVAGFQNSYDGNANFIIFDLTVDDYTNVDPVMLALEAEAEVTAILDNHEVVTGTRKGELTIWSMRTGKALRQFVSPSGGVHTLSRGGAMTTPAHTAAIKALEISKDGQYLVSASADTTLKVWSLDTEKHLFTLRGHTDEVWCCAISYDNDMIASGSRDCTIRVWRMQNGVQVCTFNCGVDVFTVQMSNKKKTVVALGDKYGARKLIMLQVVHSKVRSRAGSRPTSPMQIPDQHHQRHY